MRSPRLGIVGLASAMVILGGLTRAQAPAGAPVPAEIVAALRTGGHVLVMRHANSPGELPTATTANRDNPTHERQLDASGRADAAAFGAALRRLGIPIGDVLTSPAYRARETARLAGLTSARPVPELGEADQAMAAATPAQIAWLRERVLRPPAGANTVIVTHSPNIAGAFPVDAKGILQGEVVVFGVPLDRHPRLIGRIRIDAWALTR